MIEIRIIDKEHKNDINLPNEPFCLFGRMVPCYVNKEWSYTTETFQTVTEMTFPDENYDYDEMSKNCTFIGAYDGKQCVGLAIMQDYFLKHMYLYDLKVNSRYRSQGIGSLLLQKAEEIALQKGYLGIYTIGQDNNLSACLFYLKYGFEIGGFDNRVYDGTSQEGKADIIFYKRFHR